MSDPRLIFDVDMLDHPGNAPWVECEWGYEHCTGGDYCTDMVAHDGGWMCPRCAATADAEWDDYVWCARYS